MDTIVNNQQYAYQSSVSTTDALLQLTDDWTEVLDQDKSVKFVQNACLDFSKAFDRLQHDILLSKMDNYDFNSNVIMLVKSFLSNREQCVKHRYELKWIRGKCERVANMYEYIRYHSVWNYSYH